MMQILNPKYPISQISENFFRRKDPSVANFVTDNFYPVIPIPAGVTQQGINLTKIDTNFVSSIMTDYGTGPVSEGLASLQILNSNVINHSNVTTDIFNNHLIYGGDINFVNTSLEQSRTIVLTNLRMISVIPLAPLDMQKKYYELIDDISDAIKHGIYVKLMFSTVCLSRSRIMAKSVLQNASII